MKAEEPNWLHRSRQLLAHLPIKDIGTHRMTSFNFNPNQNIRWRVMSEQWKREKKIRIIDLKARRVGVSAQTDAMMWAFCLAYPNMNAKIVAHLAGSAEELFRVPSDLSRAFPGFALEDVQQKRLRFPHKGGESNITMATAGTPSAGRGGTLSALHLSEAAFYPSDESFTAMISSVSKGEGSIVVIESTANGREGPGAAFSEYWDNAVKGANGYIPMFLGWLNDPQCRRPEEEASDAPKDDLEKELMLPPFNATREQIAWMRRTKADDCRDQEVKWLTDYPHCPEVAFQVSGFPAFPREELAYAESTVRDPIARGSLHRGINNSVVFEKDDNGPLFVWKFPYNPEKRSDGLHYFFGADAALGTEEGDFAAYVGICGETGELACRFAERIAPEVLAQQLDMVGRFYNLAMVNVELTGNLGRWALVKLRDEYRYPKIYRWKGRDDRKRGRDKSFALGFEMNQATRRLIVDAARSGIRMGLKNEAGALVINDRALMSQLALMTIKEWRWEVMRDHDDIAVAWMIAVLTKEQYPPARYKYAPKNTMESNTPKEMLASLNIQPKDEMAGTLRKELWNNMTRAGLSHQQQTFMKGTGRRKIDRLAGI
jgi:hypothetical protein